ncbi:hypothetical protein HHI36_010110 [Cryptolaemus montrouzieri]|uniref:Uncharacterized protein n=1 Tax=Cryptolaemus montrouzieri TaxID=559131 RepID=A0ABD2MHR6_9CUCU
MSAVCFPLNYEIRYIVTRERRIERLRLLIFRTWLQMRSSVNRDDLDYAPNSVTDRQNPFNISKNIAPSTDDSDILPSNIITQESISNSSQPGGSKEPVSPDAVIPIPRAGPGKTNTRRCLKAIILTDTAEKNE